MVVKLVAMQADDWAVEKVVGLVARLAVERDTNWVG